MNTVFRKNQSGFLKNMLSDELLDTYKNNKNNLEIELSIGFGDNWVNTRDKRVRYNSYCKKNDILKIRNYLEMKNNLIPIQKIYKIQTTPFSNQKHSCYRKIVEKNNTNYQKKTVIFTKDSLLYNSRLRISLEDELQILDPTIFDGSKMLNKHRYSYKWFSSFDKNINFCTFDITETMNDTELLGQVEIEFNNSQILDNENLKGDTRPTPSALPQLEQATIDLSYPSPPVEAVDNKRHKPRAQPQ